MHFYELRQYEIFPGKMDEWIALMENEIIPFQQSRGMVVTGSFRVEEEKNLYVWMRFFKNEEQCKELYAAVYESDTWKNKCSPKIDVLLNRETIKVSRLISTSPSWEVNVD